MSIRLQHFFRQLLVVGAFLAPLTSLAFAWTDDLESRPNVLIIYTDDQGSLDAHCYGADDLVTPNMDQFAEEGVRFTSMYAPSAICSASRAGLMTGRIPARAGVPGNVSSQQGVAGMPANQLTLAELLHEAGYATGHIGKWHLGYSPETMPNGQGFDYTFGHMGGCIDNYSHFFYWQGPNRHDLWRNGVEIHRDGDYFLDMMVEEAQQFIHAHQTKPFFLYFAINAPHYPMQGTAHWRQTYQHLASPRRQYAAFTSTVDEKIGALLQTLKTLGLREKTLILVQSDHGHSTEERAFWGGGNAGPYRGAKGCLLEGGLRVPSIVSMPGHIPEGEVRQQFATGCDWFPTIAQMCRVDLPEDHILDGKSLRDVLHDETVASPHEAFFWLLGNGKNAQWAVRKGRWKLLGNVRDTTDRRQVKSLDKIMLVDLQSDIGETQNVAEDHPDMVEELTAIRESQLQSFEITRASTALEE